MPRIPSQRDPGPQAHVSLPPGSRPDSPDSASSQLPGGLVGAQNHSVLSSLAGLEHSSVLGSLDLGPHSMVFTVGQHMWESRLQ